MSDDAGFRLLAEAEARLAECVAQGDSRAAVGWRIVIEYWLLRGKDA